MTFFSYIKQIFSENLHTQELSSLGFIDSPNASFISDEDGRFVDVNNSFAKLTGYSTDELIGESISILKSGKHNNMFYKNIWLKALERDNYSFEIYNRCKNGTELLILSHIQKIKSDSKIYFIVNQEDITEKKKLAYRQQHLATHDPLTNLANRTLLKDRFTQAVFNAKRKHKKIAVFLCDLNKFKEINDNYGHSFGDKLLQKVANNLRSIIREGDTVARYGGDEFVILVEQLKTDNEINTILNEIKTKSTTHLEYGKDKCDISMSIGHTVFPNDGVEFEKLISIADSRMYNAKKDYYGY